MLVQSGVDPNVGGSHLLLGKLLHLLDGARSTVLVADAVKPLVQVDGVLASDHLQKDFIRLSTLNVGNLDFNTEVYQDSG